MKKFIGRSNSIDREINPSKRTMDRSALNNEKYNQGYYDCMEKSADKDNIQIKHKPYQCDIELR